MPQAGSSAPLPDSVAAATGRAVGCDPAAVPLLSSAEMSRERRQGGDGFQLTIRLISLTPASVPSWQGVPEPAWEAAAALHKPN